MRLWFRKRCIFIVCPRSVTLSRVLPTLVLKVPWPSSKISARGIANSSPEKKTDWCFDIRWSHAGQALRDHVRSVWEPVFWIQGCVTTCIVYWMQCSFQFACRSRERNMKKKVTTGHHIFNPLKIDPSQSITRTVPKPEWVILQSAYIKFKWSSDML